MSDTSFLAPESPGSTTSSSAEKAGFWIRFAAALIDGVLFFILSAVLQAVLRAAGGGFGLLASIAYFTYFEGSSGQTIGKMACSIRVIDAETGGPIGYGRAFLRWIGRILSTIPIFLGYFWMLWDGRKQCWHDKIASDVVVKS